MPDLPACFAVGESHEEILQVIREAIEPHIESLRENGEPVPTPHSFVERIAIDSHLRVRGEDPHSAAAARRFRSTTAM